MSSSCTITYDVFISFRGEDTRETFTVHLYSALKNMTIRAYMDCLLQRGDEVWPALEKAIESSLISIVVFSENYATSKWCLEELVKILQWREDHSQVVIPVFYRIDPSHIRHQSGSFEKAFAKYERDLAESESNRDKISNWREALKKSANISGWHSRNYADDHELIKKVVDDVRKMRNLKQPIVPTGLVGIEETRKNVDFYIQQHRVIGIWGMVGIGKTTIAQMLYAESFPHYDHACYAENAKEYPLQRLLSVLLKEEISTDVSGFMKIISSLSNKKVLIILDNVNDFDQPLLEAVCEGYKNHSRESKLIITTRHKHLLENRVDWIFEVQQWNDSKSRELLSLKAFEESIPPKPYESLVNKVVRYAGGIPLALNLLGSYLRSKSIQFWESTLEKLEKHPDQRIHTAFRKIYDELEDLDKEIFLDIAFFFHGEKIDLVTSILKACDLSPIRGIEVLQDKALITTIPYEKTIEMHGLLRQMAYEIVRKEEKDPRKRSRLRDTEEIRVVLKDNKESLDAVEGIILDLSKIKDLSLSPGTFERMNSLRFLKLYIPSGQSSGKMILPTHLEPFSGKLRYFEWHQYPFNTLPPRFCPELLVEIHMPHSRVKKLWNEKQELYNLKGIDLSECRELEELPDLSEAKSLKWVNLSGCETLPTLNSSVFSSNELVSLILDRCTNLQCVKAKRHLKSLQHISVKGCSNLNEFAVSSDLIENLDLSNTKVEKLDESIGQLQKLKCLNLEGSRVERLPKQLSTLKSLKELRHSYSELVIDKHQLQELFNGLSSLQILHLKDCNHLLEFPDNIDALSKLRELRLDGSNVTRLPATIKRLQELEILSLKNCKFLETLPELPSSVKEFSADNCISLESVSALNTLATKMVGKTKRISFNNSLKLSAGHTLHSIMESIHSTMVSAVSSNVTVRSYATDVHSYNYNSVEVCLPGDTIPEQFAYKTEKSSSITIELPDSPSNFLGFIYSVVLSPPHGMKMHGAKIRCEYNFAGGKNSSWEDITISELNSDIVYIWYDPFLTDKILGQYGTSFHLEFSVATDTGEADDSITIKECGVQIINESELQRFLLELDQKKKDLEEESSKQQLHAPHGYQNHSDSHVQTPPQYLKKERLDEKQSNVLGAEAKMKFAPNENNTSGGESHEENNIVKGEGNEETPTESEAGSPLSIDSVNKNVSKDISIENYYDQPNGMEEVKDLKEKLQEVHHNMRGMTADEPYKEKQKEANAEQTKNLGQQNIDAKKLQELHKEEMIEHAQPINSSIPSHGVIMAPKLPLKELRRHLKAKVEANPERVTPATNLAMVTSLSSRSKIKGKRAEDIRLNQVPTENASTSIAQNHDKITIPSLDDPQVALELLKNFDASAKRLQITEFVDNHVLYPYDHSITKDLDVSALCRWLQVQGLRSVSVARYAEMKFEAAKREREEELRVAREENAKFEEALKRMEERVSHVESLEKRVEDLNSEVASWRSKYEETEKSLKETEKKLEDEKEVGAERESYWKRRESELITEAAIQLVWSFENCRSQVSILYPNIDLSRLGPFKEIQNGQIVSPSDTEETESEEDTSNFDNGGHDDARGE
ncbi:disease resistance-like protein DSC1 [Arachis duranensis]|uniref:ADP-ribosyl cyclase/cyclic ADP-ribose hydrolase n=1 Tax=Arachis duranensis TaxID=130453 RepID=A0A6P4BA41_ARADU|nr:disease resistance-like protein DSC1 [Arachis duranensis]